MKMFVFLITALYLTSLSHSAVLLCDFEDTCNDFVIQYNWGITDGQSSPLINHDHTWNSSAGHFLYYDPHLSPQYSVAEISTKNWLEPSLNQTLCFRMWYYTPQSIFPISVQLTQGDDEMLVRTIASIPGGNASINDWTLIDIELPSEKFKIYIRTNVTLPRLAFDDISVDYCGSSPPEPPEIVYACDFESSCSENFVSLPTYLYPWLTTTAREAKTMDTNAPAKDYTFQNESGHYVFLANSDSIKAGRIGYLHLQEEFRITSNKSYCLNFQYYSYGRSYRSYLAIYARMVDKPEEIYLIWPRISPSAYSYSRDQWTWGTSNLPMGHYTLLFAVDTDEDYARSFALDNISILSCDYPPSTFSPGSDLSLSFACDFENSSMCRMINGDGYEPPKFNFTVFTGETLPNNTLGPFRDHTTNSTDGGFLFWNRRQYPFSANDNGRIHHPRYIEQNIDMCVKFAYYVKSNTVGQNGTSLRIVTGGQSSATWLWISLDDSQGWQVMIIPIGKGLSTGGVFFYFDVYQSVMNPVAVAFDDIEIDQCKTLIPTTTTSTSTTTTTTTTTRETSTTTVTVTPSTSTVVSTPRSTSTITTASSTTTPNNAERARSWGGYNVMFVLFFIFAHSF